MCDLNLMVNGVMIKPVYPTRIINKQHFKKRWMLGRAYHERISKKWLKRFGESILQPVVEKGTCIQDKVNNVVYMHFEDYEALKKSPEFNLR